MGNVPTPQSRGTPFLERADSLEDLVAQMPPQGKKDWDTFGHMKSLPAFQDRVFYLFQATGKGNNGIQRPPKIITTLRVVSFVATDAVGCVIRLLNDQTHQTQEIGHVPTRVFGYPIFMMVPPTFMLKWGAQEYKGQTKRSLHYILLAKTRNKAEFFSKDNYYLETMNEMRKLYSHLELDL